MRLLELPDGQREHSCILSSLLKISPMTVSLASSREGYSSTFPNTAELPASSKGTESFLLHSGERRS